MSGNGQFERLCLIDGLIRGRAKVTRGVLARRMEVDKRRKTQDSAAARHRRHGRTAGRPPSSHRAGVATSIASC